MVDCLDLKTSPVAVKLVTKGGGIPAGVEKADEVMTHCQFVDRVRRTGEEFFTLCENKCAKLESVHLASMKYLKKCSAENHTIRNLSYLARRVLQDVR